MKLATLLLAGTALAFLPQIALAQSSVPAPEAAAAPEAKTDAADIIVTGTARPERRLTTSIRNCKARRRLPEQRCGT